MMVSEQEVSNVEILSFVAETAASVRFLFNSLSSLDILVSYRMGGIHVNLTRIINKNLNLKKMKGK